jgi:hypothetical protein
MGYQRLGPLSLAKPALRVLDHDGSEHSRQSHSTIAVTPALEANLMAAVHAAWTSQDGL